ncbi:tripartite tricarboxylate transporter TctB family protein [Streptomyces sp. ISL-90]|nr:tripartite tricarboxylate transporter TctB family protein [Streptomyces sp. ISL-90]
MTTVVPAPIDTDAPPRPSRALEVTFAVIALAMCVAYFTLSTQIELRREAPPGQLDARFWPLVLGTIGVGSSVALLVIALVRPPANRDDLERIQRGGSLRVAVTCAVTLGYVAIWSVSSIVALGYRIELFPFATAIYMFLLLLVYGLRNWIGLIAYPVAVTGFIYVLFGMLLRIPL